VTSKQSAIGYQLSAISHQHFSLTVRRLVLQPLARVTAGGRQVFSKKI
jgi:hypothetical protein